MTRAALWNGPLPDAGVAGAGLIKNSAAVGDVDWSATPVVVTPASPATFTQTYATADTTVPAATAAAVAGTAATNSTPYGYAQAQADAIVTNLNALVADSLQNRKLLNKVIDVLQAAGLSL